MIKLLILFISVSLYSNKCLASIKTLPNLDKKIWGTSSIQEYCYEEVTYIFYNKGSNSGAMTVKLSKEGNVIPCNSESKN